MTDAIIRGYPPHAFQTLVQHGLDPVLARIYAARGIEHPEQLASDWTRLIPFSRLKNIDRMALCLAEAILARKRLLIVADYDSDGATACAVAIRALRQFGATVDYLVPNRFEYGYGLTPEIARLAALTMQPDILITVDNGIASVEGVAEANRLGIQVLVTDHHLPGDLMPDACVIVNPNQRGCDFPSKHLAGVGVMFYVMLALRAELRARGLFAHPEKEPNLAHLLDLVALGTVADVVKLDHNNRILVHKGLQRVRRGMGCKGIHALLKVAGRDFRSASAYELGFVLGPRLNAAGRLDDMARGIECLITNDPSEAWKIALELDGLNRKRKEIEQDMQASALSMLESALSREPRQLPPISADRNSLCLFDPSWHQGVIGILAARMKEKFHRPAIIFASGNRGELKGSGRSIPGFHLRDVLDLISKRHPGLLLKFGGHAAAAGLTIRACDLEAFGNAFEETAKALLTPADLRRIVATDGDLDEAELNLALAEQLKEEVWGQGFPQPTFCARFTVEEQRVVGDKHLKLKLKKYRAKSSGGDARRASRAYKAVLFGRNTPLPALVEIVYRLQINEFNGNSTIELIVDHWFHSDSSCMPEQSA
jgi:single-stranded-DNA-specific exonuclease